MQKQTPTLGKVLVMVGFALSCFGLTLFLWLAFGGPIPLAPKGYRIQASFGEAVQLAAQADVRIAGVNVGKVEKLATTPDGRSLATLQLKAKYAPIPRDSRAILRQKTLLGETFVELTPGHRAKGMLPENGTLPTSQIAPTVELDEIFRTFDPKTRQAFRDFMQSQAGAISGRGADINNALGNLAPFAEDTTALLQLLNAQEANVRGVINNTGTVFNALTARDGQLRDLIVNSNKVFATTARRDRDLQDLFRVLPSFQRETVLTTNRISRFAQSTNPLIDELHPAARELTPTLQDLQTLAPELRSLFDDLDPLITVSRTGLPPTARFLDELRPVLRELDPTLSQLNPILRFIGNYRDELRSFFANVPSATQACQREPGSGGRCIHYLRSVDPITPESLAIFRQRIGSDRNNAYTLPHLLTGLGTGAPLFGSEQVPDSVGTLRNHKFSFERRQCDRSSPNPRIPIPGVSSPTDLANLLGQLQKDPTKVPAAQQFLVFAQTALFGGLVGQAVPAPPCVQQPRFDKREGQGSPRKYPHNVRDRPASSK